MIGNQIDLYFHGGPQPTIGAAITILLSLFLVVLMGYYMWTVAPGDEGAAGMTDAVAGSPRTTALGLVAAAARLDRQPVGPAALPGADHLGLHASGRSSRC